MTRKNIEEKIVIEFSRPVNIGDVSERQPLHRSITAKAEECQALAARFDLLDLSNLEADLTLKREMAGRIVHVAGHIKADVIQKCIITLDCVPAKVDTDIEGFFTDIEPPTPLAAEVEISSEQENPEFVRNGVIDLGEFVAQNIALELDPYPRKDDIHHDRTDEDEEEAAIKTGGRTHRPFEVLQNLKKD